MATNASPIPMTDGVLKTLSLAPIAILLLTLNCLWFRIRPLTAVKDMDIPTKIKKAKDFGDLCAVFGYAYEEHVVTTEDGYKLGLHRLPLQKGEQSKPSSSNNLNASGRKPVVYLHHGLLTNSELFICLTDEERSLPFMLVQRGYDVWLGNNRGNKYSQGHTRYNPNSSKFWDFSIDDFARYDIPNSLQYILSVTGAKQLSYVGFSQGTAQAFAAFSMHPELNGKVNVFVALAPIMRPPGFATPLLDSVIKRWPDLVYKMFGRKSMMSSIAMWQSTLPSYILRKIIDKSLVFLFNFHSRNITSIQKIAAYPHIYCFSSVKAVVHWFQIMRNASFHMYDHNIISRMASTASAELRPFPTRNIKTPMVLMYGDQDSLIDLSLLLAQLPDNVTTRRLHNYEHLDVLWGQNVDVDVIPYVLDVLEDYNCKESG